MLSYTFAPMSILTHDRIKRYAYRLVVGLLFITPLGIMAYKLFVLDYPLSALTPSINFQVDVGMDVDGHGNNITLATYLPTSNQRQFIFEEKSAPGAFAVVLHSENQNRLAAWNADTVIGHNTVRYTYLVQAKGVQYLLPENMPIPESYPHQMDDYLKDEEGLHMDDPLIKAKVKDLFPGEIPDVKSALLKIHRFLQDELKNKNFSGYTDALTALKLGEASCNGKGRLFLALARQLNIPARLVGGIILNPGIKRVSHQWTEAYVNGHWVPFDAINDHFAKIPANFLTLYYGDKVLYRFTSDVNFQYFFKIKKVLKPKIEALEILRKSPFNIVNLYGIFQQVGISQSLLKIILMIPIGALVTVIWRNIIGVETFGTFLPALIAAAFRETGFIWGAVGFVLIIVISYIVRKSLEWVRLLHSPKMGIMLTTVVIVMMTTTVIGVRLNLFELAHITLFPIAILAITAERFAIIEMEQGAMKAIKMLGVTLMVVAACFVTMESLFLQSLMLAFPELLFVVIALNLWIGKWIGVRVIEYIRFRSLVFSGNS